jgi:oligo-1,6-glucosidase
LGQKPGDRLINVPFSYADFANRISIWQDFVSKPSNRDAWTTVFLENHDQGRSISRFGNDSTEELRVRSGKMLAIILATMSGALFLYQGQEIGMVNIPLDWDVGEYKDIRSQNFIEALKEQGASEERIQEALRGMQSVARDNARLPMQWDGSVNAGFTSEGVTPWMRVHPNHGVVNVEKQETEADSLLSFWKLILCFRKAHADLFIYGDYSLRTKHGPDNFPQCDIMAFEKTCHGNDSSPKSALVVANFSKRPQSWKEDAFPVANKQSRWMLALCNVAEQAEDLLQPYEARVYLQMPQDV